VRYAGGMTLLPSRGEFGELKDPCFVALVLFVLSLPLARVFVPIGSAQVTLTDALLVLFYVLWLLKILRGQIKLQWHAMFVPVFGFLAALVISLAFSELPRTTGAIKLTAFASYVLLIVIWPSVVASLARIRWVLAAFAIGCCFTLAIGILGILAFYLDPDGLNETLSCGYGSLASGAYPRLCAPFRNSNMLQNYLSVSVPLTVCACWERFSRNALLAMIGLALTVGALTLSNGYAGLLGGVLLVVSRHWIARSGLRTAAVGALGVVTLIAAAVLSLASIASRVPVGQGDFRLGSSDVKLWDAPRPSIWQAAFQTFREHPITGMGYGREIAFVTDARAFVPARKLGGIRGPVPGQWLEAHNTWLNIAAQAGTVGVLAIVALFLGVWRSVIARLRANAHNASRLAAGLLGAFAGAFLFHGLFAAVEEARHLWALTALASSFVFVFRQESRDVVRSGGRDAGG